MIYARILLHIFLKVIVKPLLVVKMEINMIFSKKPYKTFGVFRIMFQAAPFLVSLSILLVLLNGVMLTSVMALATARFLDTAIAILHDLQLKTDIYLPLVLLLITLGVSTTIGSIIALINARIEVELQRKLKPAMIQKYAALDFKHIENATSRELISRVSNDPVKIISDGFNAFKQILLIVISMVSVLILIVNQVWWAALVIIVFSIPMFWLSIRVGKKNYKAGVEAEKFIRYTGYLEEVLTGRDNVDERTLFGYSDEINRRWFHQYETARVLKLKVSLKNFFITKSSGMILSVVALLVALTLIGPVITKQMTAGMFMGIINSVFSLINILGWRLSNALENISRIREYMKDLTDFIALSETKSALEEPDSRPLDFQTLEFCNVRFKYPSGDRFILNGVSFKLVHGRHYAFVGKNGAGKTTITKLLTGLYNEYEGEILINGRELRTYHASTLKAMFSVVYQDFAKYYISLKENIALGDIARISTDSEIVKIATQAGLDETITELRNGINTPLGKIKDDGQDISGGQWQRVAIARSLLSRAPVKLLDEPTAALDPISESNVYKDFEELMKGKTTVFISHRLGSTKLADEILVIDNGIITERGSHNDLMNAHGLYAAMFETQRDWYQ